MLLLPENNPATSSIRLLSSSFNRKQTSNKKAATKKQTRGVYTNVGSINNFPSDNFPLRSKSKQEESPTSSLLRKEIQRSDDYCSASYDWTSSGLPNHHTNAPLLPRTIVVTKSEAFMLANTEAKHDNDKGNYHLADQEKELLRKILARSKKLPGTEGIFASNHVMINNERIKRFIAPLERRRVLDELARRQARKMAKQQCLYHSNPDKILEELQSCDNDDFFMSSRPDVTRIGENINRGWTLDSIHAFQMAASESEKNNILDRRFAAMGVGTAKADDGTLYVCQIFSD